MPTNITNEVLVSYLACPYKGHLKLTGAIGQTTEYERLQFELRQRVGQIATDRLLTEFQDVENLKGEQVTFSVLKRGLSLILDATLVKPGVAIHVDALLRTSGTSRLGDFHYSPVLFHETERPQQEEKSLLQITGTLLSELQGREPRSARLLHGSDVAVTRVKLNFTNGSTAKLLHDVLELRAGRNPPPLLLNGHCSSCEFQNRCRDEAIVKDDLSLLRGLREKEIAQLHKKGIFTTTQLSYTFRPRRRRARGRPLKHHGSLQALAVRTDTVYVFRKPEIAVMPITRIYLDIEGIPASSFYYLIGLRIQDGQGYRDVSFWADTREEERQIWELLLCELATHDNFALLHYGAYDAHAFADLAHRYGGDAALLSRLSAACVNVLSWVYAHVYFPTYSNDLKSIATCLGFKWSDDGASGLLSLAWRGRWERTKDERLKARLLRYNREDCIALQIVADAITAIARADDLSGVGLPKKAVEAPTVARGWPNIYQRNEFFSPALDRINRCAYFDYQRDRVFVRTSPEVRASARRGRRLLPKSIRINAAVESPRPSACPHCQSERVIRHGAVTKRVHDLKLFRGGVKRWNVKIVSHRYACGNCGRTFMPKEHPSTKYGDTLQAWSVYQNIALLRSQGSIVEEMRELFGFAYSEHVVSSFKSKLAAFYEPAYRQLLDRLRAGHLLHADETKVTVKQDIAWVWAFTNLEDVAYICSDTRDASVVESVLEGFDGVLVSDFYAAYDSPDCAQQKCLIHLIRDINDDLFKNPFDDELKALAADFTELLCLIIDTVDRYGLRRCHLSKHEVQAQQFMKRVARMCLVSEPARSYQRRFERDGQKLFTFLRFDGIPWNNNNAENAVKRFAFLRRVIGASSTKAGLKEYLILLSIRETLRRKNISFLRFLRAKEPDLNAFLARV